MISNCYSSPVKQIELLLYRKETDANKNPIYTQLLTTVMDVNAGKTESNLLWNAVNAISNEISFVRFFSLLD